MLIQYKEINFRQKSLDLIEKVNGIIKEYQLKGFDLTLRQIYYQLVARGIVPNNERSYKNVGNLVSDARLAGLISWHAIIDRTRSLRGKNHYDSPSQIIESVVYNYGINTWENQENYVEVWVEKDALIGIVAQACRKLDVDYFSCRGYVSQTAMWDAAMRLQSKLNRHDYVTILHLGDHDPSGIDMSRDIQERLELFGADIDFRRIALNMDQIKLYNPPPNPAKITDSRAKDYIELYGKESWELDALRPDVIEELIRSNVTDLCDEELREDLLHREREERRLLQKASQYWEELEVILEGWD